MLAASASPDLIWLRRCPASAWVMILISAAAACSGLPRPVVGLVDGLDARFAVVEHVRAGADGRRREVTAERGRADHDPRVAGQRGDERAGTALQRESHRRVVDDLDGVDRGQERLLRAALDVICRSRFAFTASALNGVPSWNVTPSRRVMTRALSSNAHSVARPGWIVPSSDADHQRVVHRPHVGEVERTRRLGRIHRAVGNGVGERQDAVRDRPRGHRPVPRSPPGSTPRSRRARSPWAPCSVAWCRGARWPRAPPSRPAPRWRPAPPCPRSGAPSRPGCTVVVVVAARGQHQPTCRGGHEQTAGHPAPVPCRHRYPPCSLI